jgi:DNA-binding response OmpR family regulator
MTSERTQPFELALVIEGRKISVDGSVIHFTELEGRIIALFALRAEVTTKELNCAVGRREEDNASPLLQSVLSNIRKKVSSVKRNVIISRNKSNSTYQITFQSRTD